MDINELEGDFLECFVAPRVLLSSPVICPFVEKEVPVKAGGKRALLVGLASLQRLFELLLLKVVAPRVDVLVLQVRDKETHPLFASH